MYNCLSYHAKPQDDARTVIVYQLETLSGIAKGLTRSTEGLLLFADDDETESPTKSDEMSLARAEPRMESLRHDLLALVRIVVQNWSSDAAVGQVTIFRIELAYV
jgi:hypothetical protein